MTPSAPAKIRTVSPSQYKMHSGEDAGCNRKWWFRYVHGLEEPQRGFHVYGLALHSVAERYFGADHAGRDRQTGQPVELFPAGWSRGLTPDEDAQIRRQVARAIERGIWFRPPEVLIEYSYGWDVPGLPAREKGVIDWLTPEEIRDHKSPKSRRYAPSVEELATDDQLLTYARFLHRYRVSQGLPAIDLTVGHNTFVKGDPNKIELSQGPGGVQVRIRQGESVFYRGATITPAALDEHEKKVVKIVGEMLDISQVPEVDWRKIPGPPAGRDSCNAYGGCAFRGICAGGEPPSMYRARMARVKEAQAAQAASLAARAEGRSSSMSILDQIRKGGAASPISGGGAPSAPPAQQAAAPAAAERPAGPPPPAVPHGQPAPINPGPPAAAAAISSNPTTRPDAGGPAISAPAPTLDPMEVLNPATRRAPWASPGCTACKGNPVPGWNTTLPPAPCRVCDAAARRAGRPTSGEFRARVIDGVPTWDEAADTGVVGEPPSALEQIAAQAAAMATPHPSALEQVAQQSAQAQQIRERIMPGDAQGAEFAVQAELPAEGELGAVPPVPKRGRGRPPGAKNKATLEREATVAAVQVAPPEGVADAEDVPHTSPAREAVRRVVAEERGDSPRPRNATQEVADFCIAIGCTPQAWGVNPIPLHTIFEQLCKMVEQQAGRPYFQTDTWQRRDAIRANAAELAKQIVPTNSWVLAPLQCQPDEGTLLAALLPLARLVVSA